MIRKCPFCGKEASLKEIKGKFRIGCGTRGCIGNSGKHYVSKENALNAWNKQPNQAIGYIGSSLVMIVDGKPYMKKVDINETNKELGENIPIILEVE